MGAKGVVGIKDNFDFISSEVKNIKKWDDEHNDDGSEKVKKLQILFN